MAAALVVLLGAMGAVFATDSSKADAAPAWRLTLTVPECPTSVTYGDPVSCTVTVTDLTPNTFLSKPKTPTGTVSLGTILNRLDVDGSPCTLVAVDGKSAACSITVTPTDVGHIAPIATYTPSSGSEFLPSLLPGVMYASQAPLTITADDLSRTYGASNPELTVAYDGFRLGEGPEDLAGALECQTDAVVTSDAGDHTIECGGLTSSDYSITWEPGTLEVLPAPLTITADDASRTYGDSDPTFGVTYDGFVLDQGTEVLDGELECYSVADPTSPVGDYAIDCGGITAENYDISWVPGTLEVLPAPEAVVADGSVLAPGGQVTVASDGWAPESEVAVRVCGVDLGVVSADASGRIRATFDLPADLPTGDCELVLTGTDLAGEPYAVVLGITISAEPTPTPGPTPGPTPDPAGPVTPSGLLPYTGASVTMLVLVGGTALAAGAALVVLRRRNRVEA